MRSDRQTKDQQLDEGVAKLIGALLGAALALLYPQSLGAMIGAAAGAAHPWSFDDHADRHYWRALAGWSIAAGVTLAAAYALVATSLGVDVELWRFHRQWAWGHLSGAAFVDHPWAWLPLASAAALVGAGGAILWRTR